LAVVVEAALDELAGGPPESSQAAANIASTSATPNHRTRETVLPGSVGRDERSPGVARPEEAMGAARTVGPGDVVLGRADLPRVEHRLHDPPRPLDLVEAQEGRVV